jgi:hypothetical protein
MCSVESFVCSVEGFVCSVEGFVCSVEGFVCSGEGFFPSDIEQVLSTTWRAVMIQVNPITHRKYAGHKLFNNIHTLITGFTKCEKIPSNKYFERADGTAKKAAATQLNHKPNPILLPDKNHDITR